MKAQNRDLAIAIILAVRCAGGTLRQSAHAAGVHVATLCRWQRVDLRFRLAMQEARPEAHEPNWTCRPTVQWRKDCPECNRRVVVRSAPNGTKFWRCENWPECAWASWRPRASRNCKKCGGACFWSHSRKSIGCSSCGLRIPSP